MLQFQLMIHERKMAEDAYELLGNQHPHYKITRAVSVVRELHLIPHFPIQINLESDVRDGAMSLDVINDLASGSVTSDRVMHHFFGAEAASKEYLKVRMRRPGQRRQVANLNRKIARNESQLKRIPENHPLREKLEVRLTRQITARDRIFWGKAK